MLASEAIFEVVDRVALPKPMPVERDLEETVTSALCTSSVLKTFFSPLNTLLIYSSVEAALSKEVPTSFFQVPRTAVQASFTPTPNSFNDVAASPRATFASSASSDTRTFVDTSASPTVVDANDFKVRFSASTAVDLSSASLRDFKSSLSCSRDMPLVSSSSILVATATATEKEDEESSSSSLRSVSTFSRLFRSSSSAPRISSILEATMGGRRVFSPSTMPRRFITSCKLDSRAKILFSLSCSALIVSMMRASRASIFAQEKLLTASLSFRSGREARDSVRKNIFEFVNEISALISSPQVLISEQMPCSIFTRALFFSIASSSCFSTACCVTLSRTSRICCRTASSDCSTDVFATNASVKLS
mmetsp:Transcript_32640/g.55024  ORF Transcript_32640/g.55024 Transcript_32640/m.55024 type:complete len:363 (-) Transcript_32640:146-1234(-)